MKLLLILFSFLLLSSCSSPDPDPNKMATIVVTSQQLLKDTINIEYYQSIHIDGNTLHDGNHLVIATNVIRYNIIGLVKPIK